MSPKPENPKTIQPGTFAHLMEVSKVKEQPEKPSDSPTPKAEAKPKAVRPKQEKKTAPKRPKEVSRDKMPKKQISAMLTIEEVESLNNLQEKLSPSVSNAFERSEIVGSAIRLLESVVGEEVPAYKTVESYRAYVRRRVDEYLKANVEAEEKT